jgi:hypothetical protein
VKRLLPGSTPPGHGVSTDARKAVTEFVAAGWGGGVRNGHAKTRSWTRQGGTASDAGWLRSDRLPAGAY